MLKQLKYIFLLYWTDPVEGTEVNRMRPASLLYVIILIFYYCVTSQNVGYARWQTDKERWNLPAIIAYLKILKVGTLVVLSSGFPCLMRKQKERDLANDNIKCLLSTI